MNQVRSRNVMNLRLNVEAVEDQHQRPPVVYSYFHHFTIINPAS